MTVTHLALQAIDLAPEDGQAPGYSFLTETMRTAADASVGFSGDSGPSVYDTRQSPGWLVPISAAAENGSARAAAEVAQTPGMLHVECETANAINLSCSGGARAESTFESGWPLDNFSIAPHTTVRFTGDFTGSVSLTGLGCIENQWGCSPVTRRAQVITVQGPPPPIPEPASAGLVLLGLAFLGLRSAVPRRG